MGCFASSERAASVSKSSTFDKQLIEAVRRHGASRPRVKSLDAVLLRLPAVRDMVESCRAVFAKAHAGGSGTGQIALADFAASAEALQLKLPAETLKQVLAAADVDGDHKISFKEFTVLLVLCWLLRPASAAEDSSVSGLDRALNTLCDAFLFFDTEGHGWISKANVESALGGGGGAGPGGASGSMRQGTGGSSFREANAHAAQHAPSLAIGGDNASRRRFSEMDFDHNGRVSFPEFVAALESWAGVEEED